MGINDKERKDLTFWNRTNIGITLGIFVLPFILFWGGLTNKINFDAGNAIALFAAELAVIGTLYSNNQNDIRNDNQLTAAKNNLKRQLIFDKKSNVMLKVYKMFMEYPLAIDNEMYEKKPWLPRANDRDEYTQTNELCKRLAGIMEQVNQSYYLPENLKKTIIEVNGYVKEREPDPKKRYIRRDPDPKLKDKLKEVYSQLQYDLAELDKS